MNYLIDIAQNMFRSKYLKTWTKFFGIYGWDFHELFKVDVNLKKFEPVFGVFVSEDILSDIDMFDSSPGHEHFWKVQINSLDLSDLSFFVGLLALHFSYIGPKWSKDIWHSRNFPSIWYRMALSTNYTKLNYADTYKSIHGDETNPLLPLKHATTRNGNEMKWTENSLFGVFV